MARTTSKSTVLTSTACIFAGLAFLAGLLFGSMLGAPQSTRHTSGGNAAINDAQAQEQLLRDRQAALDEIKAAIEREPGNAMHWIQLGNLYYDSGLPEEAIPAYEQALTLNPDEPDVRTDLGAAYRMAGNPQRALELFEQVIAAYPTHQHARFNKGVVLLFELEQPLAAVEAWKQLLEIYPNFTLGDGNRLADLWPQILLNAGHEYEHRGKTEPALQVYDLILRDNPADLNAMSHKAQLLRELSRNAEALPLWQAILQANPTALAPDGTPVSSLVGANN